MDVAKRYQDEIESIKTNVRRSYDYFKPNYDRYNEYRRFVFETSLRNDEINLLSTMGRPQLEFNILEAYISRLLGEFSKQEPDIEVSASDQSLADPLTIKVVEQHLKHTLTDNKNHHTKYEVYKDLLSGGFSSLKVMTDYENPMSMNQVINIERVYDPTLCGYDMFARYSHKGDGDFCFELFPKSKDDFMQEYPDVSLEKISFKRGFEGFNWSFMDGNTPTVIVCDYYKKKKKETKIVKLRTGKVITLDKYNEMLDNWNEFTVPPGIIGKPRKTTLTTICRYRLIENLVIEYEETDFSYLPLVFVDGNSILLRAENNSNIRQFTRPYVYHAKGAQRLKNYAGISLANEIENTVQHKFMVAKEALPKEEDFLQAYKDIQKASVMIFNSVHESNPDMPIANPIREIQRMPAPPEIVQAFTGSDSLIQQILGSYDASLGINNNQLSGVAVIESATQSNAAAMPYIVGYLNGYQRAAQIYVDLMPKYFTTPRTIPIIDENGQRNYVRINQDNGLPMEYDSNILNVSLTAGASFQIQKSRTIMMIKEIMGMSPLFAQFIADKGLNFVLDNMDGRGIEQLKQMVVEWQNEMKQQKQMAMNMQQQQMQNNPMMMKNQIEMKKLEQKSQKDQSQLQLDIAKLRSDQQKVLADIQIAHDQNAVELVKAQTERFSKQVDLEMQNRDMKHRHNKEAIEVHHKMSQPTQNASNII